MLETDGRRHGEEDEKIAYRLQVLGAREGAIRGTLIAGALMGLAHRFPLVRRQTLAGRAFVVSWGTIFGMVIYADHYLLEWEQEHRIQQEKWREAARRDLSSRGQIPTESAMRRWKDENEAKTAALAASPVAKSSLPPSSASSAAPSSSSRVLDELKAVNLEKEQPATA